MIVSSSALGARSVGSPFNTPRVACLAAATGGTFLTVCTGGATLAAGDACVAVVPSHSGRLQLCDIYLHFFHFGLQLLRPLAGFHHLLLGRGPLVSLPPPILASADVGWHRYLLSVGELLPEEGILGSELCR